MTLLEAMQQNPEWDFMQPFLERHARTGISKLFATWKCLRVRKEKPKMFSHGSYVPLALSGHGGLAVAFARYFGDDWCIVVVGLAGDGKKKMNAGDFDDIFISLPANSPRKWSNVFTGETIRITKEEICVKDLLKSFPVAVLSSEEVAR
jgi:(1->4)-alpha-D-glucan 1-alpha-D-glucosylmutase